MGLLKTTHVHNNTTINRSPERVDIHEHKAPTDKSIQLLNEFQEKAKDNIFKTFEVSNNYVNGAIIYYDLSPVSDKLQYAVNFNLNGRVFKIDGHIDRYDLVSKYPYESLKVQELICSKIAETIAIELINQFPFNP